MHDTETDTETDKVGCIELCSYYTETLPTPNPIVSVSVWISVSGSVNAPLTLSNVVV